MHIKTHLYSVNKIKNKAEDSKLLLPGEHLLLVYAFFSINFKSINLKIKIKINNNNVQK